MSLDEVSERFDGHDVDWWVAGGRAIDLFLGWETRRHEDLDIEMFRNDREMLFDVFDGWQLFTVSEGAFTEWNRGVPIEPPVFGIWGRPTADDPWAVEVMLADGDGREWRFRRDPTITMPRSRLTRRTDDGLRYCAPEVQLLYKSKQARPKDDLDFARTLHHLDSEQRVWLRESVRTTNPDHPWVAALEWATEMPARRG